MTEPMLDRFARVTVHSLRAGAVLPGAIACLSIMMLKPGQTNYTQFVIAAAFLLIAGVVCAFVLRRMTPHFATWLGEESAAQESLLNAIDIQKIGQAVFWSAAASLILELALIRWQSSLLEFFAFYKNFSLVACFAGLGTGYSLSRKAQIPVAIIAPLACIQFVLLIFIRHILPSEFIKPIMSIPFTEQLHMGADTATSASELIATYGFLAAVFMLTAVTCVPVGQLCGKLMDKGDTLKMYGMNLLGSLAGILTMIALGYCWTPPVVWFSAAFLALVQFITVNKRALALAASAPLIMAVALAWPVNFPNAVVHSPYQVLEAGPGELGCILLKASGTYYQRVHNLSKQATSAEALASVPRLKLRMDYYNFPYRVKPGAKNVLVVGAGTGNDVAAALRGGAEHVDAVEIDPAIEEYGYHFHPEKPYSDPRVTVTINDARAFLRQTHNKYDLIVFGLLDSHGLGSHASNLRLDSYVYTVQALKEARAHLQDDGLISLSFCMLSELNFKKIARMMTAAFDGRKPLSVAFAYDGDVSYLASADPNWTVSNERLKELGTANCTHLVEEVKGEPDISTDDWPFFYMANKTFPVSYLTLAIIVVALAAAIIFFLSEGKPTLEQPQFAFLGAGFMLIETKAITELGLHFGNTWLVTGIVIAAILLMAFFSNLLVSRLKSTNDIVAHILVLVSIGVGYYIVTGNVIPATTAGNWTAVVVLTCPIFFSGIAFSSLIRQTGNIGAAMSMNILGAIAGAMLEYSAMALGYSALYGVALVIYGLSLIATIAGKKQPPPAPAADA